MYRKLLYRFSRRTGIDINTLEWLLNVVLELKEQLIQSNASPEMEMYSYMIIKNMFLSRYCRNLRPPKTFFGKVSSLFRKKKTLRELDKEIEKLIEQIKVMQ